MIAHIVLLQPNPSITLEEINQVLQQVEALQQSIPGILSVSTGHNLSANHQGYTCGFIMHFVDETHLKNYAPHPAHRVVSDELQRICTSIIDFDLPQA